MSTHTEHMTNNLWAWVQRVCKSMPSKVHTWPSNMWMCGDWQGVADQGCSWLRLLQVSQACNEIANKGKLNIESLQLQTTYWQMHVDFDSKPLYCAYLMFVRKPPSLPYVLYCLTIVAHWAPNFWPVDVWTDMAVLSDLEPNLLYASCIS